MTSFRTASPILLLALTLLLSACGAAGSDGDITVGDVRAPIPAGPNGAVYMTLTNDSAAADQLTGAQTDVAESVELHETQMADGSMQMQQMDSIEIPADGQTVLEPGGRHVMLVGVDQDLTEGDTVTLTLSFANAGEQEVSAEVVPIGDHSGGASASPMAHDDMEMSSEG